MRDSFALVGKSGDEVPRYFYSYLFLIARTEAYALVARTMIQAAEANSAVNPSWWNAEVVRHEQRGFDLAVLTVRLDQPMA
ncbi:hypothetical protein [Streptomyces spiralis]|uniref:hypothetical protein n=1 Tax=Streptomyces spiralis TaxID=66376 RepID=UPI0033CA9173